MSMRLPRRHPALRGLSARGEPAGALLTLLRYYLDRTPYVVLPFFQHNIVNMSSEKELWLFGYG